MIIFVNWIKSKQKLITEIENLKFELCSVKSQAISDEARDSSIIDSMKKSLDKLMTENKLLSEQVDQWKQKYADEVQKRLDLMSKLEEKGANQNDIQKR